jgi:hypothetical protein
MPAKTSCHFARSVHHFSATPRYATMLFGQMARWELPGSRKHIEFGVKAKADVVTRSEITGQPAFPNCS